MRRPVALLLLMLLVTEPGRAEPQEPSPPSSPTPSGTETTEVVVVGKPNLSKDRSQAATPVSGQALRDSARASVFETLSQQAADLYVPARGAMHGVASGASGGLHIRGLGGSPNSQVLVVEDGVPDYQGIFGHPIPDAYVPFLVDDALIVKGGDSVLYGTNAMGGVVVLRSRWRGEEGYEILNDAAYGSYATLRESMSLLGRFGPWDLATGLHALSTDGHRAGAGGKQAIGIVAARRRLTPELSLTARNKVAHIGGGDPGSISHPYVDHWYDVWRDNASLQLEWRTETLRLTMTQSMNVGIHRLYDGFYSRDRAHAYDAHLELLSHRAAELLVGLASEHVDGNVENRITSERALIEPQTSIAPYGQLTWRPHRRLGFVLGARELYSTTYGSVFLYKGGVRYSIGGGFFLRARAARNFRQPTMRELYLPYPTANPNLKPERSLSSDAGAGFVSEHFEVSCSAYRTEADDLIKYFGAWPTSEVVNIDHLMVHGIEATAALKDVGPASLVVTGDRQDVGRYTRQNPDTKLDFTLVIGRDIDSNRVEGSLTGEWVRGLFMANYGRQPIDDVFSMDLTLRYRRILPGRGVTLEPYVLLRNLLDSKYAYIEGYQMPGFNVLAGLRLGT